MSFRTKSAGGAGGPVDRLLPELAGRRVLKRLDRRLDDTEPARRPSHRRLI